METTWDDRYAVPEYVYGFEPNQFLKSELATLIPGHIIFPAEGEGRNSVYAAKMGWKADAFDFSAEGRKKAIKLARQQNVSINYALQKLEDWQPEPESYDCVALIFVHQPDAVRKQLHAKAVSALKPGGKLILEAFNPRQLPLNTGGPKNIELLYTSQQLQDDFKTLKQLVIKEKQTPIEEGALHHGISEVIRVTGVK